VFYIEKPIALLPFFNVNTGRKKIKNAMLKIKRVYGLLKPLYNMVIKETTSLGNEPWPPVGKRYQLNYHGHRKCLHL
jgi:hypothetical protein